MRHRRHAVELASRGWQVTGIDLVPKALSGARARAQDAGVEIQFVHGDVTALGAAGVGSGFRLLLDGGTVHGLKDAQREAVIREVNEVAATDATWLIFAFAPRRRGPAPRGMGRKDIETTFAGWKVTDEQAVDVNLPGFLKADPRWYRLQRD
ncbi:MAG: class I SAM-dependent methyltransferase [Actinobacteria bacterium]|nr:class I SAM-dependent methyltransferase [Actinomycetota bacterium]